MSEAHALIKQYLRWQQPGIFIFSFTFLFSVIHGRQLIVSLNMCLHPPSPSPKSAPEVPPICVADRQLPVPRVSGGSPWGRTDPLWTQGVRSVCQGPTSGKFRRSGYVPGQWRHVCCSEGGGGQSLMHIIRFNAYRIQLIFFS